MEQLRKAPWAGWETVRLIGRGSYGTVYEIRRSLADVDTETAALKVITIPQNPGDIEELQNEGYDNESITDTYHTYLKGIVSEYAIMRKMEGSANVVNCKDIHYVQHEDGFGWDIYIRMELLTPLMKALPVEVSEATVVKVGKDICSALVHCKKLGIVHRDIKPQNIFATVNGDYKLGDFGIAKTMESTMRGTRIGTFNYMPPEIYNDQPYGSTADIYSLGLVLYWLLNERRMPFVPLPPEKPVVGQDVEARLRRLGGEPLPPPAHGSEDLKRIVLKACAFAPEARYASASEMLKELSKLSFSEVVVAKPTVTVRQPEEAERTMLLPTEAVAYAEVAKPAPQAVAVQQSVATAPVTVSVVTQTGGEATALLVEQPAPAKLETPVAQPAQETVLSEKCLTEKDKESAEEKARHRREWYEFQYEEQKRKEKERAIKIGLIALGCVAAVVLIVLAVSLQVYISS